MKLKLLRRYPYLLTILMVCSSIVFLYLRYVDVEEKPFEVFEDESITKFVVDTTGCQIPDWDPWDPSVKEFYEPVLTPYKCLGRPSLLRALPNGVVTLERTIVQFYYDTDPENVSCSYKPIYRDGKVEDFTIDFNYKYGPSKPLKFDVPLADEFLKTECILLGKNESKFVEYLTLTPLKPRVESQKKNTRRENLKKLFNVMFVGIDSISRLQFERHFPKCSNYLKERVSSFMMRGYTKVGDNTFPNLMPLLTGHFYQHYWNDVLNKTMFFDDVDFLWKEFSERGYRTFLAEDAPAIATFNYYRSGFKNPPTDYYYRPFALAVENSEAELSNAHQCIGNKMEMTFIYDYLKNFVLTMNQSRPFFSFVFLARLTHDVLNQAGYADEPTYQLLKYLEEFRILDNTIVVFFSDHGIRYGPIRKTYIGQFEERMPFMYLIFPKWFSRIYPQMAHNLKINEARLTTPFDIHATILDVLNFEKDFSKEEETLLDSPGISLFRQVSPHRTCQLAWISPHWCTCQIERPVPLDSAIVIRASTVIATTINRWTTRFKDKCSSLKLQKIHKARILKKSSSASKFGNRTWQSSSSKFDTETAEQLLQQTSNYMIVISTSPGSALFEATVQCNKKTESCEVLDDISRINRYGQQSECIDDVELKKYCYCS